MADLTPASCTAARKGGAYSCFTVRLASSMGLRSWPLTAAGYAMKCFMQAAAGGKVEFGARYWMPAYVGCGGGGSG